MCYVEGRTRWAEGQHGRVPGFAADLVRRQVAVIMATGGSAPAIAAKYCRPLVWGPVDTQP